MKNENEMHDSAEVAPHVAVASYDNTMDFMDLWNVLARYKIIVFTVAIVTFGVVVADTLFNKPAPLYKVRTILGMPSESDIKGIEGYLPKMAFREFISALKSREVRREFFGKSKIATNQHMEERFNKMLSIIIDGDEVSVTLEGKNAEQIVSWLNGFVNHANKKASQELIAAEIARRNSLQATLESKIDNLRQALREVREKKRHQRETRIAQLEEQAVIAKRIGIKEVISSTSTIPHYTQGTKALLAEAKVLRERKSDDPFDDEIRDVHYDIEKLQFASVNTEIDLTNYLHISTAQIMQLATVPASPFNQPVLKWALMTALLGGLVMGVLAALFADFLARAREKKN